MTATRPVPLLLLLALVASLCQLGVAAPASAEEPRHGLRGDYYVSSAPGAFDFHERKASVLDPNIEFPELAGAFNALTGQEDDVTVRWTGRLTPEHSEAYTFSMIGDNGFRLWVDGELAIDNWVDNWDVEKTSEPIELTAGKAYDVKIEYFEHYGGQHLRLRWQSANQPKEIVPMDAFTLPDGFDPPGPGAAEVTKAGDTARLDFATELRPLPADAAEHFELSLGGTSWPVTTATLDPADASVVVLRLQHEVPEQAGNTVRTSYDGEAGITRTDGSALPAFTYTYVANHSTYTLRTRWTDDVNPDHPLPEYPRPQMARTEWQNLNGRWQFAAAEDGEAPPFGRQLDERIVVPYPVESTLSGIGRHEDRMWYRRTFTVPPTWRGQRLLLHLDAVDWRATVYVNGERVGVHEGGYDRFSVDVTKALKRTGRQELVVGVSDPTDRGRQPIGKQRLSPGGIFYTSVSGIWQTVWMEPVPAAHVTDVDSTPDVAKEALRVTVDASLGRQPVTVRAMDGNRVVGTVTGHTGKELRLPVPDPELWSPDDPFLYGLDVRLANGDRVTGHFGMRTVAVEEVDGVQRIMLNGEPVFNMGPLDQGYWPDGIYTAPTDAALRYDLVETKRLGFNTVRKHVKVESDRWYYWADKLGVLVWQDMPSMFGDTDAAQRKQFETELREMVDQHRSHPSIVMWVPFNEGWGQYDQARIADLVKSWDPSRLVNNMSGVNCCGAVDGGNGDVIDFHIYPGPGTPGEPSATRAAVLGEYGGLGLPVVGHTWTGGGWGYAVEPDPEALTDRYVQMSERLRQLRTCRGLSGAIYTQTTDVETELNGLMTYDRAVTKPDADRVREANRAVVTGAPVSCEGGKR